MPLDEFHPLISHNRIGWKLMHADSNGIRVVLTTPFIRRSSNTVSFPSLLFTEASLTVRCTVVHIGFDGCTQLDLTKENQVVFWLRKARDNFV